MDKINVKSRYSSKKTVFDVYLNGNINVKEVEKENLPLVLNGMIDNSQNAIFLSPIILNGKNAPAYYIIDDGHSVVDISEHSVKECEEEKEETTVEPPKTKKEMFEEAIMNDYYDYIKTLERRIQKEVDLTYEESFSSGKKLLQEALEDGNYEEAETILASLKSAKIAPKPKISINVSVNWE